MNYLYLIPFLGRIYKTQTIPHEKLMSARTFAMSYQFWRQRPHDRPFPSVCSWQRGSCSLNVDRWTDYFVFVMWNFIETCWTILIFSHTVRFALLKAPVDRQTARYVRRLQQCTTLSLKFCALYRRSTQFQIVFIEDIRKPKYLDIQEYMKILHFCNGWRHMARFRLRPVLLPV